MGTSLADSPRTPAFSLNGREDSSGFDLGQLAMRTTTSGSDTAVVVVVVLAIAVVVVTVVAVGDACFPPPEQAPTRSTIAQQADNARAALPTSL